MGKQRYSTFSVILSFELFYLQAFADGENFTEIESGRKPNLLFQMDFRFESYIFFYFRDRKMKSEYQTIRQLRMNIPVFLLIRNKKARHHSLTPGLHF